MGIKEKEGNREEETGTFFAVLPPQLVKKHFSNTVWKLSVNITYS